MESIIALLMLVNNEIKEARIQPNLSRIKGVKQTEMLVIMLNIDVSKLKLN